MKISHGVVVLFLVAMSVTNYVSSKKPNSSIKASSACSKGSSCPESNLNRPTPFRPRSCLDYLKKYRDSKCGFYQIYDNAGNSFPVYCDMKTEPGNAWTLVMSWTNENRRLSPFSRALKLNAPVRENAPNFNLYRQTLSRLQSIKSHSTHWRATCSYPTHGVDYKDYVSGNFRDFDIMTFISGGSCKKVEYINIRGHVGIHTTARWLQSSSYTLHIDSSVRACGFRPAAGAVSSEDNFGYYRTINPKFRCTANDKSTTQWWFGGHL